MVVIVFSNAQNEMIIHFRYETTSLLSVLLLLISISGFISPSRCQLPPLFDPYCPPSTNDTANPNLNSNVSSLLDSLSSKASSNVTFYNETSNGIYGLFLCRGDVSNQVCGSCVSNASQQLKFSCSSQLRGTIWYDKCMMRYSVHNFFGIVEIYPGWFMWNVQNRTSPDELDVKAYSLMYILIDRVKESDSDMMFEADENESGSRYGLVQCTRDISKPDCGKCLIDLMAVVERCCSSKKGWRVLRPNCNLRYEDYRFYQKPELPPPTSPAPPPGPDNDGNGGLNTKKIIAITISTVAGMAILLGLLYYSFFWRKKTQENDRSEELPLRDMKVASRRSQELEANHDGEMHYFSLSTLKAATDNFSDANRLGEGGFGPVYKGKLIGGEEIAVKRLSVRSNQGHEEFKNEAMVILKLQHKNLVRLLGCCIEGDEKLLVYEYMPNTSLDAFLFDPLKCKQLDWLKRENIINGIARGVMYLHEDSRLKIIHRDLKASNVLLDDEMNPKISDFGTARIFGNKQIDASTNRIVGTYGYMAPEYAMEGLFSVKSDVYSFGVLMLEVISGRKSIGFVNLDRAQNLLSRAWELWNEGRVQDLIDKNLVGGLQLSEAVRWIRIALLCVQEDPNIRPTMTMVVLMLGSQSIVLPQPLKPPFLSGRGVYMSDQCSTTEVQMEIFTTDQSSTTASI